VRHLRSDAYSAQVLLNKRQIGGGAPKLHCYLNQSDVCRPFLAATQVDSTTWPLRLQNDLHCVGWGVTVRCSISIHPGVKLYSLTRMM